MTTPTLTRRSVIVGTAAAGVAAGMPAANAAFKPSPEFLAWQRAYHAYRALDDDDEALGDIRSEEESKALEALVDVINAKPVTTLKDVRELAIAEAHSGYENGVVSYDTWIGESNCEIEQAIVSAILRLGGNNA